MPRAGDTTRRSILDAAERLFAERGPEAVSLNEINTAARQRNTAAVHYHFKSRKGLLDAVLERHLTELDTRRAALLDALEPDELDPLVRVFVLPLAEKLADRSGRCFLRIQARLAPHTSRPRPATARLVARVAERLEAALPPRVADARGRLVQLLVFPALAEQARLEERRPDGRHGRALFVENLIDAVVGVLAAPISERTAQCAGAATRPGERLRRRPPRGRTR